ncbi:MAG: FadR family transcriptional regulator [Bryobacteraceae bacterium]|nr:FadR family transcriptional regulator [Bryobacteraceae bacterium]
MVSEMERMLQEEYREPGLKLPKEAELADRFRVSRIVIREAIKVLEDRGLVEVRAGRGTLTASPTPERVKASLLRLFRDQPLPTLSDMERMLELREVLEETVATLAAVRATPEDLALIAAALSDMALGKTDEETIEADFRFHMAVAKAAHNRFFEMVIDPLTQVFLQQIRLTDIFEVGVDLHRQIFEQINRGDPVAARQAVRRLMRNTRADAKKALGILSANGQ